MNSHVKYAKYLGRLDIDPTTLNKIFEGYSKIFFESSWEPWNAAGPATTYDPNFSSTPSASQDVNVPEAGGGDAGHENRLSRNVSDSPGSMRDNGEETREQWVDLKEPKKFKSTSTDLVKKFIDKAQGHIPKIDEQISASGASQRFYNNFHAGLYNDEPKPPF